MPATSNPSIEPLAKGPEHVSDRKTSFSAVLDNPNIPSPPAVVLQIVENVSKPDCDPGEVLKLLARDSGLTAQVLKTVNSGLFGLAKPVSSLKQAVMLLGLRPLRSLVLSLALPAMRITDRDEMVLVYWQESVAGAVIARQLAQLLKRPDPDDDLMAGLLRDIGVLVFREALKEEYRALWKEAAGTWTAKQCELERDAFGLDHAEISAVVLESWHLPADVHQPIRYHHDPAAFTDGTPSQKQRAWMLNFASKVATLRTTSGATVTELLKDANEHFGMDQAAVIKFLASITPAIQEIAAILKVDIGQCPNYPGIVAAGCQELVRLAVDTKRSANDGPATSVDGGGVKKADTGGSTSVYSHTQSYHSEKNDAACDLKMPPFTLEFMDRIPPGGAWLNGYEVREILGRGAMGVVFKAFDPSLNRFAAVKMMTPERLVSSEARAWFQREARAAAAIQHENVITIYSVSDINGVPYLVLEFLSGTSLQDRVDEVGSLDVDQIIRYGRQIASGLAAAQNRGVIHRDIKPANILFTREGDNVKITDFGLARVQDDVHKSRDGVWVGTPLYMAPEQFCAKGIDHRADLFSLGSLLYTLCAGQPPFGGDNIPAIMNAVCNGAVEPLTSYRGDLPAWLIRIVEKLHAKKADDRYQTAAVVVEAFDRRR